jgi:hypothetical protein
MRTIMLVHDINSYFEKSWDSSFSLENPTFEIVANHFNLSIDKIKEKYKGKYKKQDNGE